MTATKTATPGGAAAVGIDPSLGISSVTFGKVTCVLFGAPTEATAQSFAAALGTIKSPEGRRVTDVVRACQPTYEASVLQSKDIDVHELPFEDGAKPDPETVTKFLQIFDTARDKNDGYAVIGIHCIAGLGRSATLAAIAMVEDGCMALEAVRLIREKRHGAFNSSQLQWVSMYKAQGRRTSSPGIGKIFKALSNRFMPKKTTPALVPTA